MRSYLSDVRAGMLAGVGMLAVLGGAAMAAVGERGAAEIKSVDGKVLGTIALTETTAGVLFEVTLSGLTPGGHAIHVTEVGQCAGDFAGAGPIYNPLGGQHGFLSDGGPMAGNLPNVFAGADGKVKAELLSPFVTLSAQAEVSLLDADGAAIVILERPDDHMSEPDGNAGARIACGVVTRAK